MADFINTIDALGDNAVMDGIVDRSITEFKDDRITQTGLYSFRKCTKLVTVSLPSATTLGQGSFIDCTSLVTLDLPKMTNFPLEFMNNCSSLITFNAPLVETGYLSMVDCSSIEEICFPKLLYTGTNACRRCRSLKRADFSNLISISDFSFVATQLSALILRNPNTVATLNSTAAFKYLGADTSPIGEGTGYIYVPEALIEDYKVATNWSTYADQFRALEDWTADGTITGALIIPRNVSYVLSRVACSNSDNTTARSYYATLTSRSDQPISEVVITMDGADITNSVYNPNTGEIFIELVTGDIVIQATAPKSVSSYNYLYELPQAKTFNGTSDYIDTGIKLFDTAKDFTIICVADFTKLDGSQECLLHCMNEAAPYPGLNVDGNGGVRLCYTGASSITQTISNRNDVKALAFRYKAGVLDAIRYVNAAGTVVTFSHNTSAKYTTVNQNLLLGAYQTTAGVKGRYYNGTISVFRVYEDYLSDDDLADELITAYEEG